MNRCSPRGSQWNRWDLHFHTPASYDYLNNTITNEQIVQSLRDNGVRVVAITDHHTMDITRIADLQRLGGDSLTVLPGIELRADQGGEPIHYICIFPEDADLKDVWTHLQGKLNLTPPSIRKVGGDQRVYVPIEKAAASTRELGGVISIHAGAKSNSIESIRNTEQFQQRIKYDITNDYVDLMEIGQIKDIDRHLKKIFPATGLKKPLILCSDNHNALEYRVKAPTWFRADPTFRGLLMVLREPGDRVYIGPEPPDWIRIRNNPTKYIDTISFSRKGTAPTDQTWFSGEVPLNPGLVAIVGNKGSGKSALADTVGLLGASRNGDSFSFLSRERFRHPKGGFAQYFDATIKWISDDSVTKCLANPASPEEVERIKYLPQDHVEQVCNELAGLGEQGFEQELKAVIFSHVPDAERLGQPTLDELVRFQSGEKQKRIDSLLGQLREASRLRAHLEEQADPGARRQLLERIKRRELELEAHAKAKPAELVDPASAEKPSSKNTDLLQQMSKAEMLRDGLAAKIEEAEANLKREERRHAVAKRLLERIQNFEKDVDVFKASLQEDTSELGVSIESVVSLTVHATSVMAVRDAASKLIAETKRALDSQDPPGFRNQHEAIKVTIEQYQSQLDAPNRAYQAYLKALAEWKEKQAELDGSEEDPESLRGLKAALAALDKLPERIGTHRDAQLKLALQVHAQKVAQAEVFRTLYGPVQQFIDSHSLARDKLRLEFRAALTDEAFADRFLALLAMNKRGSFYGIDEARARISTLLEPCDWEDGESVRRFLTAIDDALHKDLREGHDEAEVQVKDQLLKGRTVDEVYEVVYGLEYIRPRYVLRWEGKDLSMLSPGERGTLLLVFYLLIDKSDTPLVIDQPEGNLDNHTVAKVLVECIKEARRRRQVFIVTHNPNLAVVCDADQVVYASMDKEKGNAIAYTTGALENPEMSEFVTDVLEGTRWAFGVRAGKYDVGKSQA